MILQKNEIQYNLTDRTQIDAFLGSGWLEVERKKEPLPDLSGMTIEQLKAFASESSIELTGNATKPIIIEEIQKAWDSRAV